MTQKEKAIRIYDKYHIVYISIYKQTNSSKNKASLVVITGDIFNEILMKDSFNM